MNFTKSQLQAIAHDHGNLQIIACAGSGKTEVVARRVATLFKNGAANGLQPISLRSHSLSSGGTTLIHYAGESVDQGGANGAVHGDRRVQRRQHPRPHQ